MRVLIRFLRAGPAGAVEQKDKLYDGESVTLGRATDQVVQLKDRRVALAHAQIILRNGHPVLISRVPGGVLVNGTLQREARLRAGDVVTLGANVLRILPPPAGCELAFSFELDPDARPQSVALDLPRLRLAELGFGKRRWSWALFLGVFLLALAIPSAGLRSPQIQESLRASLLPDDHWWSPGPLSRVHEVLGTRCDACHQKLFQRVRNDACLTCHASNLHQHWPPPGIGAAAPEMRCASCHAEHHEPATLVRQDPAVCINCHRDLKALAPATLIAARVTDFAADHPGFAVPVTDESGLKFPHDVHLAKDGIRSPVGDTVLGCKDCHALEPGGARFRPVQMQRDCGGCHLLDFDPAYPERTVPHGDAKVISGFLVDYYSRRYLEAYADPLAVPGTARRTGPKLTAPERERLLRTAREQSAMVTRDLFERRSCAQCHDVTRDISKVPDEWQVKAVKLRSAWLKGATFNHAAHSTALTSCESCHGALDSKAASDVLLPDIATCRECHAGGDAHATPPDRLTSTCNLCHGFHGDENPLWQARGVAP